jgi:hypothetical protein
MPAPMALAVHIAIIPKSNLSPYLRIRYTELVSSWPIEIESERRFLLTR